MIAGRIARELIVSTNRWPGFEHVYRVAYDGALRLAVGELRSVDGVLAILLRETDSPRRWVAGLSDFDLTVLTDDHDTTGRATSFLTRFWKRYRSTKKKVLPLGETEIMTCAEYSDFVRFGPMPTASLKRAVPLFVQPDSETAIRMLIAGGRRPPTEREVLLDALSRYARFFLPAHLDALRHPSAGARRRTDHLLRNVETRLSWPAQPTVGAADLADRFWTAFAGLTDSCRRVSGEGQKPAVASIPSHQSFDTDLRAWARAIMTTARVDQVSVVRWTNDMSRSSAMAIVVPDDISRDALERLTLAIAESTAIFCQITAAAPQDDEVVRRYFARPELPTLLSASMWRAWCQLSPFDGLAAAATSVVLYGEVDPTQSVPTVASIGRDRQVQYAAMLPLKNNWRPVGAGRPELYTAIVNRANRYRSAASGDVHRSPEQVRFASLEEGYTRATEALAALRATL